MHNYTKTACQPCIERALCIATTLSIQLQATYLRFAPFSGDWSVKNALELSKVVCSGFASSLHFRCVLGDLVSSVDSCSDVAYACICL